MIALLLLATFVCSQPSASENPFRAAKVGDWIEHRTKDVLNRQTVTAKTDDSVTIVLDQTVAGQKREPIETKIDLKAPWPPPAPKNTRTTTKSETLGTGTETITIDGKKYDCTWVQTKSTFTYKVKEMEKSTIYVTKV